MGTAGTQSPGTFSTQQVSILSSNQQSAGSVTQQAAQVQGQVQNVEDAPTQQILLSVGNALTSIQQQIDSITKNLRSPLPFPSTVAITDPTGNMIAWMGYQVVGSNSYDGIWARMAYFGGTGPANANIIINGSTVTIEDASIVVTSGATTVTIGPGTPGIEIATGSFQILLGSTSLQVIDSVTTEGITIFDNEVIWTDAVGTQTIIINDTSGVSMSLGTETLTINSAGLSMEDPSVLGKSVVMSNQIAISSLFSGQQLQLTYTGAGIPQMIIAGNQVVTTRQAGPGTPAGFADPVAQAWCQSLHTALGSASGHGLIA